MDEMSTATPMSSNAIPSIGSAKPMMDNYKYAGFWMRWLALIIDGAIQGGIGYLLFGNEVTQLSAGGGGYDFKVEFTGWKTLIPLLYVLGFWMWISATPGKYILGMKIIQADGSKLTPLKAVIRYFSYVISGVVFMLGFITAAFNPKKQGWHDKIAKTYVIYR